MSLEEKLELVITNTNHSLFGALLRLAVRSLLFNEVETDSDLRRKRETVSVNGYKVPAPCREEPSEGAYVYVPEPVTKTRYVFIEWDWGDSALRLLKEGLIHESPQAARKHALAMIGRDPEEPA